MRACALLMSARACVEYATRSVQKHVSMQDTHASESEETIIERLIFRAPITEPRGHENGQGRFEVLAPHRMPGILSSPRSQ